MVNKVADLNRLILRMINRDKDGTEKKLGF